MCQEGSHAPQRREQPWFRIRVPTRATFSSSTGRQTGAKITRLSSSGMGRAATGTGATTSTTTRITGTTASGPLGPGTRTSRPRPSTQCTSTLATEEATVMAALSGPRRAVGASVLLALATAVLSLGAQNPTDPKVEDAVVKAVGDIRDAATYKAPWAAGQLPDAARQAMHSTLAN